METNTSPCKPGYLPHIWRLATSKALSVPAGDDRAGTPGFPWKAEKPCVWLCCFPFIRSGWAGDPKDEGWKKVSNSETWQSLVNKPSMQNLKKLSGVQILSRKPCVAHVPSTHHSHADHIFLVQPCSCSRSPFPPHTLIPSRWIPSERAFSLADYFQIIYTATCWYRSIFKSYI